MLHNKKTLVLGASSNPSRYSYLAVKQLLQNGYPVEAIGNKKSVIDSVTIHSDLKAFEAIDTVTIYIREVLQKEYYNYIISLKPKRIIFNPGTENPHLAAIASQNNIQVLNACTLVLLRTKQY